MTFLLYPTQLDIAARCPLSPPKLDYFSPKHKGPAAVLDHVLKRIFNATDHILNLMLKEKGGTVCCLKRISIIYQSIRSCRLFRLWYRLWCLHFCTHKTLFCDDVSLAYPSRGLFFHPEGSKFLHSLEHGSCYWNVIEMVNTLAKQALESNTHCSLKVHSLQCWRECIKS